MQITIDLPDNIANEFYNRVPAQKRDSFLSSLLTKEFALPSWTKPAIDDISEDTKNNAEQQAIKEQVEKALGMVTVDTTGQDFNLMTFNVGEHITLFDED